MPALEAEEEAEEESAPRGAFRENKASKVPSCDDRRVIRQRKKAACSDNAEETLAFPIPFGSALLWRAPTGRIGSDQIYTTAAN